MSWRSEIKEWFAKQTQAALGQDLKLWGAWNTQTDNATEDTFGDFAAFFEYSEIGQGLEYTMQTAYQKADKTPVNVTLHLVFNNQSNQHQDLAYQYAEMIIQKIVGKRHPLISGIFTKIGEFEDSSHKVQYEYQITFAFQVIEAYCSEIELTDANPEDEDGNPLTGRRITFDIIPEIVTETGN